MEELEIKQERATEMFFTMLLAAVDRAIYMKGSTEPKAVANRTIASLLTLMDGVSEQFPHPVSIKFEETEPEEREYLQSQGLEWVGDKAEVTVPDMLHDKWYELKRFKGDN